MEFTPITWICSESELTIHVASFDGDKPKAYAVRNKSRECLNLNGELEDEPFPSSRTDDFLQRCRYPSLEKAQEAVVKYNNGLKFCPDCQKRKGRSHFMYQDSCGWVELPACKACLSRKKH